ncbi:MAG: MaoC family dehydratase [Acidimicrobiia bacterium]
MGTVRYFEDFPPGQVTELGSYPPLTEEQIVEFARQWDPQYFHVDPVRAKESLFGGLVASGWQTGAILMRLYVDNVLASSASLGSPGLDQIRFLRPVRPGDRLAGRQTVLEAEESASRPGVGKLRSRFELFNQDGDAVFMMEAWGLFQRRPD